MDIIKTKILLFILYLIYLAKYSIATDPINGNLPDCKSCTGSTCNADTYCYDNPVIKKLKATDTTGGTAFGKKGAPTGNIFFHSDNTLLTAPNNVPTSIYYCTTSGCEVVKGTGSESKTYFNSKYNDGGCIIVDTGDKSACVAITAGKSYYDTSSKKVVNCSTTSKCTLSATTGYYIDSGTKGTTSVGEYLIKCINNSCETNKYDPSQPNPNPEFYINASLEKSSLPLIYHAKSTGTYELKAGDPSLAYLDYSSISLSSSTYTNLITCQSTTKCTSTTYTSGVFLGPATKLGDTINLPLLIECSTSGCNKLDLGTGTTNSNNEFYIDELSKKLIKCISVGSKSCDFYDAAGKYFMNYATKVEVDPGTISEAICTSNIISCDSSSKCTSMVISSDSNFIDGDTSQNLIICATFGEKFLCTTVKAINLTHYYVNNGNNKGDYPLIYCGEGTSTDICVEKKASTNGYYMTDNGNIITTTPYELDNMGYLISCSRETKCERLSDRANDGYYVNAGVDITKKPLIFFQSEGSTFIEDDAKAKDTYYLDASSFITSSYSDLIYCPTQRSCSSITPKDGYYYNAVTDDPTDIIIKCDKTGCNIGEEVQQCIVDEDTILYPGNYCYQRNHMRGFNKLKSNNFREWNTFSCLH